MTTHSGILAWEISWTGGLMGYIPQGLKKLDIIEATQHSTAKWDVVEGVREVQEEGTQAQLWMIYADIWQKATQQCKAIILQLNLKK